ncbi:MAG: Ig-like domain-containing protein [Archangium sp.]|nr:Ig-like domain-containing protein [Archangium sp.]
MVRFSRLSPLLALALAACPPIDGPDGGNDNEIVVGPAGGLFIRNGYGVEVPAGAFAEEQRIFVTLVDGGIPEVPMRKRISAGYRLSPLSLVPKSPLTLYLPWVPDLVPAGVDPGTYDMRRQNGSEAYASLPGAKTNMMPFAAVEAKTDKLGVFWVTSPSQPNIARLELEPEEVTLNVGESLQFTARVVSPTGETIDAPVTWRVVPMRVALTDASGLVTGLDPGVATLTASSGMQSVTAKVSVQGSTVGPRSYVHENPFPTGNDLRGGAIAPAGLGTVYAGSNGTVLVENAVGAWSRVFSVPSLTLKAVGGTSLTDAVAIGSSDRGTGVLVEFKGATLPPSVREFQPAQISDLTQLWFDGTHGMGVGAGNEVVIRRNGLWTTEYHPSFEALISVIGDGAGGYTVVGDLGSIYQWDPLRKVWDSLYDTRLAVKLDAAQLVSPAGEAWAVGGNRLWHFTGAGWVAESLPATPALASTTTVGVFDSRVVVGGVARIVTNQPLPVAKGVILVRAESPATDGGMNEVSWTSFPMRGQQVPRGVFGGGLASPEGRVVGDLGAVWAWNSATADFTERSRGFQGDVADLAVIDTDVFAAVNECADVRCLTRRGTVMHQGPSGYQPLGALPTAQRLHALVARGPNDVIASGDTSIFRWDGTSWGTVTVPVPMSGDPVGAMNDLVWCGSALWGASEDGNVYQGNAASLSTMGSFGVPLTAIHCPTPGEVWLAGTQLLASRKSQGTWAQVTATFGQAPWQAVWSPGAGEAFAFGDAVYGVYFNTKDLVSQDATGGVRIDVAEAMWGNKIDNLYMTGITTNGAGFMLRFDGINWSPVDPGASRRGTALGGRSTNEIWLGTEGGGVLKAVAP